MTKKHIIYILCIGILSFISINRLKATGSDTTQIRRGISLGYWGQVSNSYGCYISLEKYRLETKKYKIIRNVSLIFQRRKEIYISAGLILGSNLRRTYKWGGYFEHGIKFGYIGNYYDLDFYKTNGDGNIVNIGRKWVSSLMLGYSFGIGYDFSKLTKANLQLFIKPNLYYKFPDNDNVFYLNNYSMEVGLTFHPKWLK